MFVFRASCIVKFTACFTAKLNRLDFLFKFTDRFVVWDEFQSPESYHVILSINFNRKKDDAAPKPAPELEFPVGTQDESSLWSSRTTDEKMFSANLYAQANWWEILFGSETNPNNIVERFFMSLVSFDSKLRTITISPHATRTVNKILRCWWND